MVLCLWVVFTSAQAQVLQWSNPVKLKGAAIFTKVIGENQHGIYLLRYRNRFYSKNIILEKYNHLLTLEESRVVDLRNARLIKLYCTSKGLLVIKSQYNKGSHQNDLKCQWYDFGLKTMGKPIVLASLPVLEYGDRGNFRLRLSDNQKHIALVYTQTAEDGTIILNQKLYNDQLTLIASKDVNISVASTHFIIKDFLVTNRRRVNLLCKVVNKKRRKVIHTSYSLYDWHNDKLQDFLMPDSLAIKSATLSYVRAQDKAQVVAFYSQQGLQGIDGTMFYSLDSTSGTLDQVIGPFTEKMLNEVHGSRSNEDALSEGFRILKVVPRMDGGTLIVTEQEDIATENEVVLVNGIPQSTSKNIFNYNEILLLNYDSEGFLEWHKLITKNQTTINDGGYYSSAVVYVGEKFVQVLYNDQLRSSGDVMQHTIYNNGHIDSKKMLKSEIDFVAIIPTEAKQVASNKVIIPTSKNRRFSLLKLVYH